MNAAWRALRILDAAQGHGWSVTECESDRIWSITPKCTVDPLDPRGFTVYAIGGTVRVVAQRNWKAISQRDALAILARGEN